MLITCFVRFANMKLFCNQNKINFMFTTLIKHVNNQTKLPYCFGKVEKNMDLSRIYLAVIFFIQLVF